MSHVQRAKVETRMAYLFTEFGLSYATRLFGQEAIDALPRYTRGRHKGQPKGLLYWSKCVEGGWLRDDGMRGGHVQFPGFMEARIEIGSGWGTPTTVLTTKHPSFEIKMAREAEDAAQRQAALAEQ